MTMKPVIVFTILATTIFVSVRSDDPYRFELLKPRGFRVLRPGTPFLRSVVFVRGSIDSPIRGSDNGISYSSFSRRGDGWWVYENTNFTLNPGDTFFYTTSEVSGWCGLMYNKQFHVPVDAQQVSV